MNRMPRFLMKVPTAPQFPHFIWSGDGCDPHEKKCTPMIKKEIMLLFFLPLPLGEGWGEGLSVTRFAPSPNPSQKGREKLFAKSQTESLGHYFFQ